MWHCLILWVNESISDSSVTCWKSPSNLLSPRADSRRCLRGWNENLSQLESEAGMTSVSTLGCSSRCTHYWQFSIVCVGLDGLVQKAQTGAMCVLEGGKDIKGVLICSRKCVGGPVQRGQLLGLANAPVSWWSFLTCISFLQTPYTSSRKLWHPPAAPDLLWLLLDCTVYSPSPYGSHKLLWASIHPRALPDALPDPCVVSSVSSRLCPFCTSAWN